MFSLPPWLSAWSFKLHTFENTLFLMGETLSLRVSSRLCGTCRRTLLCPGKAEAQTVGTEHAGILVLATAGRCLGLMRTRPGRSSTLHGNKPTARPSRCTDRCQAAYQVPIECEVNGSYWNCMRPGLSFLLIDSWRRSHGFSSLLVSCCLDSIVLRVALGGMYRHEARPMLS